MTGTGLTYSMRSKEANRTGARTLVSRKTSRILKDIYNRLFASFGPQHWWPGKTKFEVMVGAILTQNTNWSNVERAIANLRKHNLLSPGKLKQIPANRLATLIKPAGYFNIKAKRLKNFIDFFIKEYNGDIRKMSRQDTSTLRNKLLAVNGIGHETADSILLYALEKPVFVVDAYTKRMLIRHYLASSDYDYYALQRLFMNNLKPNTKMFNEYHALIVRLSKEMCKTKPQCGICPLNTFKHANA